MAEIVGFVASIGGIVTIAAQVGTLIWTYINEVKDAPEVLSNLFTEITSLNLALCNLEKTIDSDAFKQRVERDLLTGHKAEHWRFIQKTVENCQKTLESLKNEWDNTSGEPQTKRRKVVGMFVTHFRLATNESMIKSYRLRIGQAKDSINLSISILLL